MEERDKQERKEQRWCFAKYHSHTVVLRGVQTYRLFLKKIFFKRRLTSPENQTSRGSKEKILTADDKKVLFPWRKRTPYIILAYFPIA